MTQASEERVKAILSRLHLLNVGAETIKNNAKLDGPVEVTLKGRYALYILEEVERRCVAKKRKCDWFTSSNLYIQMKYCSVEIRRI